MKIDIKIARLQSKIANLEEELAALMSEEYLLDTARPIDSSEQYIDAAQPVAPYVRPMNEEEFKEFIDRPVKRGVQY